MAMERLKRFVREHRFLYEVVRPIRDWLIYTRWALGGRPLPPVHAVKARRVKEYGRRFSTRVLVETGTFLGGMIQVNKRNFDRIYSIELGDELYRDAVEKFKRYDHVSILHGDSAKMLPAVLGKIDVPCLFWLDGHYSEGITARGDLDTPIRQELDTILSHPVKQHVILIDDAHCFVGQDDYPTIEELRSSIHQRRPDLVFEVEENIIRIHPPPGSRPRMDPDRSTTLPAPGG